jgi:hypothetical protein
MIDLAARGFLIAFALMYIALFIALAYGGLHRRFSNLMKQKSRHHFFAWLHSLSHHTPGSTH